MNRTNLIVHELRAHAPFTDAGTLAGNRAAAGPVKLGLTRRNLARAVRRLHPLHVLLSAQATAATFRRAGRRGFWRILAVAYFAASPSARSATASSPIWASGCSACPTPRPRRLHRGMVAGESGGLHRHRAGRLEGQDPHAASAAASGSAPAPSLFHVAMAMGVLPLPRPSSAASPVPVPVRLAAVLHQRHRLPAALRPEQGRRRRLRLRPRPPSPPLAAAKFLRST